LIISQSGINIRDEEKVQVVVKKNKKKHEKKEKIENWHMSVGCVVSWKRPKVTSGLPIANSHHRSYGTRRPCQIAKKNNPKWHKRKIRDKSECDRD
jgi:hypothetical protein